MDDTTNDDDATNDDDSVSQEFTIQLVYPAAFPEKSISSFQE